MPIGTQGLFARGVGITNAGILGFFARGLMAGGGSTGWGGFWYGIIFKRRRRMR